MGKCMDTIVFLHSQQNYSIVLSNKRLMGGHMQKQTTFFMILIFYLESILRVKGNGNFLDAGLYLSIILGGVFAFSLSALMAFIRKEWIKWLTTSFFTLFLCFLYASQMVYFQLMRTYYSVYSAGNTGRALEFIDIAISAVGEQITHVILILLPFLICVGVTIWSFKSRQKAQNSVRSRVLFWRMLYFAVLLQLIGIGIINQGSKLDNSPYSLYYHLNYPEFSVNQLGLLTTMRLDFQRTLFPSDVTASSDEQFIPPHEDTVKTLKPAAEVSYEDFEASTKEITYNVLPIDFEALAEKETDATLKEMHQYFQSRLPSNQNDKTGKYEGYNVITITAEGFSHLAIREDVTPTLYKMANEGIRFNNFYTAIWGVSTSDGEYVATTGLIPKSGVWSYRRSAENDMMFALGNQLKQRNYLTKAYHNHTYTYYDRHLSHPNMGYDYKGVGNGLEIKKTWPESDLEMMEVTIPEFIKSQPFHTYYMTVSGHMFYDANDNAMASKNWDVVKDLPYSDEVKAYLATQVELDRAMAYLLQALEEEGILDKTLIVISADHYPYGLSDASIDELNGSPVDPDFERYKNALIMYSGDMKPETYDAPASSLDILPTVLNLLNLPFDSRLLMGRDLFSDTEPLVIMGNRSFITSYGRYNSRTGEFFKSNLADDYSEEALTDYRKQVSAEINAKFYYAAKILDYDYYRMLRTEND